MENGGRRRSPAESPIGVLYRKMSAWYIALSVALAAAILLAGLLLARPLLPLLLGR